MHNCKDLVSTEKDELPWWSCLATGVDMVDHLELTACMYTKQGVSRGRDSATTKASVSPLAKKVPVRPATVLQVSGVTNGAPVVPLGWLEGSSWWWPAHLPLSDSTRAQEKRIYAALKIGTKICTVVAKL